MSEWRSACVTAPYPPELLPNTPRRPLPPHLKRCSVAGSISCSRKSSQAPIEAELMYWLPPSRVKQSGKATTTGGMRSSPISRSSRSGKASVIRSSPEFDNADQGQTIDDRDDCNADDRQHLGSPVRRYPPYRK